MEKYPPYSSIFQKLAFGESQMLDKAYYEEEVKRLTLSFDQQVKEMRGREKGEGVFGIVEESQHVMKKAACGKCVGSGAMWGWRGESGGLPGFQIGWVSCVNAALCQTQHA